MCEGVGVILDSIGWRLLGAVNRTDALNERPFDSRTPMRPPSGRGRNWAHYGVMVPGLPEPHRFFGVMSILGTPGIAVFANDHAITTTPADTVYTVSATAAMSDGQFFTHSIAEDCEFRSDGSYLRYGDDLLIEGTYPSFTVHRHHREVEAELEFQASQSVSHFAHIPGIYDHWSVLARCRGTIRHQNQTVDVDTLGTVEYATGTGLQSLAPGTRRHLPVSFFTYHVLNIDDTTQVLMGEVLAGGLPIQRRVYVRRIDEDLGSVHRRGFDFSVSEYQTARTPAGQSMAVPARLHWHVLDHQGEPLVAIDGVSNDDYAYGLGAGFVGSYDYTGSFRDRPVTGTAYQEYIDIRGSARRADSPS